MAMRKSSGGSASSSKSSFTDCHERVSLCIRVLLDPKTKDMLSDTWTTRGKVTFGELLETVREKEQENTATKDQFPVSQTADLIHFRQLRANGAQGGDLDLDDGSALGSYS
jgi:hypothetical protein